LDEALKGKIARILSPYIVAINLGSVNGVKKGMIFAIVTPELSIEDPDSRTELGSIRFNKGTIRITDVHEKFSLGESTELVPLIRFPNLPERRRLNVRLTEAEFTDVIKVGDEVIEVKLEVEKK
jgi:hypothetical protein